MPILNSIISLVNLRRLSQIDHFKSNPEEVQKGQLMELVKKASSTELGRYYDFASIKSIKDFQERVPVQKYEQMETVIDKIRHGDKNVLWPGEIKWFAKSSGTTSSKSKFIPVSKEALEDCHFRGGKDVLAIYNRLYPETEIFSGKGLTLGGSQQLNKYNSDSFYGDLSAILIGNLPFWVHFIRTPDQSIALMDKWEEKLIKMTEATINENVTSLTGVPSWFLVLIKHLLEFSGKSNLLDIWPNLELFIHGGINFGPYREQYRKIIPSDRMHYMETYNASEGFFAIQDDPNSSSMLLMLDYGIFYEFIPTDEWGKDYPKALTIEDVELNTNYAIVISTNGGLWRYVVGDTIQFTSKYPHKIVITGRTKHFINAFGEEVIVDNSDKAIDHACKKTGAIIKEYTAAPMYMSTEEKGRHQWIIEFEKEPKDLALFSHELDKELQSINSDYEAKRYKDITLEFPQVVVGRKNLFFDWMKKHNKLGGQNKVPRLSNNRDLIEELMAINQKR
ncbi:GH3 auxin-responsive promoter family protein [Saccharicrinis fermentans]|uniref:GH3 auxin-responsive promoter n=1 Tax=Saccharicrinis fermentans DSM 9555 = JCM 21142 TaxID=869213 RepID=W7YA25_9BACT|nr:GH3 auxin-responsive promoter family protein [Saccharicrinis fermentans]GAF05172.1 GH3 auxin-responsive promoter [Saccharicrinis fermentans DSM 9555 = JCM 21142]